VLLNVGEVGRSMRALGGDGERGGEERWGEGGGEKGARIGINS
jgi:hypothetical protein